MKHDELKSAIGKDLGFSSDEFENISYVFGQLEFGADQKIDAVVLHDLPDRRGINSEIGISGIFNAINPELLSKSEVEVWYDNAARFRYSSQEDGLRRLRQVS